MNAFDTFVAKFMGSRSDKELKGYRPLLQQINSLEIKMTGLSDEQLKAFTPDLKQRIENGAPMDELIPESFAVVREVGRRVLEMRHFDVQLLGGMVLHHCNVAEMKTGEGKTLVATLPVYLNALTGKGAHVITVNDYLASRDADWMGKIYKFLGLSVGKILSNERDSEAKQLAYAADVTYGTNNEFGFDYLRDNMKFRIEDFVQRGHNYAIVDEVDSILIDEARTPLIISGPTNTDVDRYYIIDGVIPLLQADIDYTVDEKSRAVNLTDSGVDRVEERLGITNIYDAQNMEVLHHINQSLRAHTIFRRDRDYVVQDSKVVIVDEHTGRLMSGRRWSDGLHQAIEAKEKLEVEAESQTYASITFQNYFRMYEKLAGMTGTAVTEEEEFQQIYNLNVTVLPTNVPVIRDDVDDIVYKTQSEKYMAVLDDIASCNEAGQPVLVGTVSVEKSEIVSRLLRHRGIEHEVLNARNHSREADIVAEAGRLGAVTISTNMAGRGTDIKLGGDPEFLARTATGEFEGDDGYEAELVKTRVQTAEEKVKVIDLGGLRIIGTERHESRRVDNQLRGRSGRQGDSGSSRFFLSLEDDLLRIFGSDKIVGWMERMGLEDDEPIEHRWITRSIENAQKKVEGHNFNIRKNLLEYDDIMNLQRRAVYSMRRQALEGDGTRDMIVSACDALVSDLMAETVSAAMHPEVWKIPILRERFQATFGIDLAVYSDDDFRDMAETEIGGMLRGQAMEAYERQEAELGTEAARQIERMLILQHTDQFWKDHLLAMDRLREGIGLRGYGQRNPLLEYKKEGTSMYMLMTSLRDEAVVSQVLRMEIAPDEEVPEVSKKVAKKLVSTGSLSSPAPAPAAAAPPPAPPKPSRPPAGKQAVAAAKQLGLGRNDPCPCGSGRKLKKCCGSSDRSTASPA
jgi:preprotein translocase subunit SecA